MKRAGFTMIELIFVIVILGILAAVALPKFIGVSEQAEAGKCIAAVGTMNRTVGPSLWSDSLMNGSNGSLIAGTAEPYDSAESVADEIARQFEIPEICGGDAVIEKWLEVGEGDDINIGEKTYNITFVDGTNTSSATWKWNQVTP